MLTDIVKAEPVFLRDLPDPVADLVIDIIHQKTFFDVNHFIKDARRMVTQRVFRRDLHARIQLFGPQVALVRKSEFELITVTRIRISANDR